MAREGLRTLVAGRRMLTADEYQEFEVTPACEKAEQLITGVGPTHLAEPVNTIKNVSSS